MRRSKNRKQQKNISNSTNQLLNYFQFVLNTSLYLSSYISHHLVTKGGHLKCYFKKIFLLKKIVTIRAYRSNKIAIKNKR